MRLRKAFALLVTLSVLSVLIVLVAMMIRIMDDARLESVRIGALIEANALYADTANILKKSAKEEAWRNVLLTTPLPISTAESDFSAMLSCKAANASFNINWYPLENNISTQPYAEAVRDMFQKIETAYEIDQPVVLESLLEERFHASSDGKKYTSETALSYGEFVDVLTAYVLETGDMSVWNVPWRRLLVFSPVDLHKGIEKIAADYMDTLAVSLYFDIEEALVREMFAPGTSLRDFLIKIGRQEENFSEIFAEGVAQSMVCEVRFLYKNRSYAFRFDEYEGEVNRFVFLEEQT